MFRPILAATLLLPSLAFAGTPTHAGLAAAKWAPMTEKSSSDAGTIKISTATVDGIGCFRAVAQVDVPAEAVLKVVADIAGSKSWSTAGVTQAEVLANKGDTVDYWQYLDVPNWTMSSDRFWFLSGKIERSPARLAFTWSRLVDGGPYNAKWLEVKAANSGAVEPPINVGGWFMSEAEGVTTVDYQVCTDAGGSIPTMVQTAATKKTLPDTVGDAVREARKRAK